MSVQFDKSNEHGAGDWLKADGSALAPTSFSFSVSLWVYFEAYVENDPETIWYFGDQSEDDDDFIVLEAFPDPVTDEVRVRVRMKDDGTELKTGDSGVLSVGEWHLVTVVVGANNADPPLEQITLYVDAQSAVTASADLGTTNEGNYDLFALGRRADASSTIDSSSCHCEQVAIWDSELTSGNHSTLRADPEGEEFLRRPPSHLTTEPHLAYWVLAGHHRHGLLVSNHDSQRESKRGDRNNEAGSSKPDMVLGNTSFAPRWSCQTPAVLYPNPDPVTESELPTRRRKVSPSRYNPQFFVFSKPELIEPWSADRGNAPMWDNPNFVMMARVRLDHSNDDTYVPPIFTGKTDYLYRAYLTQITRRIADWFEYQRFEKGRGSEGDGNYEGTLYLQDLGWQYGRDGDRGLEPDAGVGFGIPLEQNRQDDASSGDNPWACWFNKNGKELTKEYADKFWPLLKAELDRRGLCYPKRLHWDLESSPEPKHVMPAGSNADTFTPMLSDDRSGVNTPNPLGEILADGQTLDELWDPAIGYTASLGWSHDDNIAWRQWYLSWQSPIRQEAIDYAMMAEAVVQFPLMKWSNYLDFVADNEDYKYFQYDPDEARNSPVSSIAADYSAPVLYPSFQTSELVTRGFGATKQSAQLRLWRDNIDACVNTSSPLPICPWITSVGYRFHEQDGFQDYAMTREDLRHLLWYCWQRGVNEFALWITNHVDYEDAVEFNETYEECDNLVKTVKCMMNTNGTRTSRMGRTYRICR